MKAFNFVCGVTLCLLLAACNGEAEQNKESQISTNKTEVNQPSASKVEPLPQIAIYESAQQETELLGQGTKIESEKVVQYQKPGAGVQFEHDYDGQSEPEEVERITLSFPHRYQAGSMSIQLTTEAGLEVLNNISPYIFALDTTQETIQIETELTAQSEGKYYLNITVSVDDLTGNPVGRAFSLAYYVGDKTESTKLNLKLDDMTVDETNSDSPVILMPAEETITQQ